MVPIQVNDEFNTALPVLISQRDEALLHTFMSLRAEATRVGATTSSRLLLALAGAVNEEIPERFKAITEELLAPLEAYDVLLDETEAFQLSQMLDAKLTSAMQHLAHLLFIKTDFRDRAFGGVSEAFLQDFRHDYNRKAYDAMSTAKITWDRGIAALIRRLKYTSTTQNQRTNMAQTIKGKIFIAMPMAKEIDSYVDVHEAIKAACAEAGFDAARVDEVGWNEPITLTVLRLIEEAEYVICDLTDNRPNVFYEAGYALGIGKTPIYIAKNGSQLEFDLKDYPVIFFGPLKDLRSGIVGRLNSLKAKQVG